MSILSILIHLPDDLNHARTCIGALPRELLGHVTWHYAAIRSAEHLQCRLDAQAGGEKHLAAVARARITMQSPPIPFVLCADPIHLTLGRDQGYLEANAAQLLTDLESQYLLATLNAHFSSEGVRFFHHAAPNALLRASAWCAAFEIPLEVRTTPLAEALDGSAATCAPQGTHARRLRAIETEIQMLLHEHPVNHAREECRKLPVNSVWFWGEADAAPATGLPQWTADTQSQTVNFCHIPPGDYQQHAQHALRAIPSRGQHAGLIFRQHFCWAQQHRGANWRFWQPPDWRLQVEKLLLNQMLAPGNP